MLTRPSLGSAQLRCLRRQLRDRTLRQPRGPAEGARSVGIHGAMLRDGRALGHDTARICHRSYAVACSDKTLSINGSNSSLLTGLVRSGALANAAGSPSRP